MKGEGKMAYFYRFYRAPFLSEERAAELIIRLSGIVPGIEGVATERVFCVESTKKLNSEELDRLLWLLGGPDRNQCLSENSLLGQAKDIVEIGPRLHFETANSTNAVSICQSCGLTSIVRLEEARRYRFQIAKPLNQETLALILPLLHDKMTECPYPGLLTTFETDKKTEPVKYMPVMEEGIEALREANKKYGTGMDEVDLNYYFHLFHDVLKRNPTDVEWCDLGNSTSEHSRHHVFGAKLIIDGQDMPFTLMEIIKSTLTNPANSIIAFHDNASAIRGYPVNLLIPQKPGMPSVYRMAELLLHYALTCETHNHPCLWAAYPGAGTGGGGRRRDGEAIGRGGRLAACSAGFIGGNLYIPGYPLPWEDPNFEYDPRVESPLSFFLNAVRGAFDDGNQFGEPVIISFFRSFGLRIGNERWENIKPIMFSGGFSFVDDRHTKKNKPEPGWLIVRIGGKAYNIGFGGGSASSMMQGENTEDLDFKSVQRADGEMANKVDRVIRTCVNMGDENPIEIIHDQGAGGPGNVLKELMDPAGGKVNIRNIILGDKTMSPVEIWVAEFQENIAVLIKAERWSEFEAICQREKCPVAISGTITGDGKAVVVDEETGTTLVDLGLENIFGKFPQKTFKDERRQLELAPLELPNDLTVRQALEKTFALLGVCSQEWATQLVDRAVTPHVVQQQCVGPNLDPISTYSVIAPSPFAHVGEANAVGLRPEIGLISAQASARMAAAEALLNLMFVPVSKRDEIKASINWMLAAKLPGGFAWLYDAALALRDFMNEIGMDADGGKDSLSLAAQVGKERIRSLSTVIVSTYAACPDYRLRLQPYFKKPGQTKLMFIDLANGQTRLGGSALAQVHKQVGIESPDAETPTLLNAAFDCVQAMLQKGLLVSGHRRGRNGLISALCEAAFAGNCGFSVEISHPKATAIETLFSEELGFVLEYLPEKEDLVLQAFAAAGLADCVQVIGRTSFEKRILISHNGESVLSEPMPDLRALWRETSFQMKSLVAVKSCVRSERDKTKDLRFPPYNLTFDPDEIPMVTTESSDRIPVAVIREEGTNSDQEIVVATFLAGFAPYDVTLTDLAAGRVSLKDFRGVFFPGGFSFKDVLGSATGFAGVIKFNQRVAREFSEFFARPDTFSFGPCNGCQLGVRLSIPWQVAEEAQPRLMTNQSEVFESRFPTVIILDSPAIMLKGMAGSVLGIHLDHGEGRFVFPDKEFLSSLLTQHQAPIRFVDDHGSLTEAYPFNPNGSDQGIAGVCSADGRHLYMMPHPERTVLLRQWHYLPNEWEHLTNSPWLRMFQNAYTWCREQN